MSIKALILLLTASVATASPVASQDAEVLKARQAPPNHNDFSCRSTEHPNPVIIMHGLGATYYEDLNYLESYLKTQKFCTFSITYGDYPFFPYVGGLDYINASAIELATFVREVQTKTGAAKVDFVGHSEGAFQALYVPKFTGVANIVQRVIAIAPPTHGTTFANLYTLSYLGGNLTNSLVQAALAGFGCRACTDLVTNGAAVKRLNTGAIAQPSIKYTILTSKFDELVTPVETAFVNEPGVENRFIQDYCPNDPVGHIGEAYDLNVWKIVQNRLSDNPAGPDVCVKGSPGK
ncbi:putative lipase EstA/Esterase EstB, alpha/Beta hydrolase [Septoria linicola]|nr:putative lipase EstA/Esterase EstB, alpha/Beta hydrolase [Septoria linicola]